MSGPSIRPIFVLLCALPGFAGATLDDALARMDRNSTTFKSVSANVRQTQYTAVIKEEDVSEGTLHMKRSRRDVQFLVEFTSPDKKSVALSGTKAEIYYPKNNTVEEYEFAKGRLEKYLALGFGASGSELKEDYTLRDLGVEQMNGEKAARVELTPKSTQVLQQFPKIELWLSQSTGYPVQQKLHQTAGDYYTIAYSNVMINPSLPDSAYKLTLPKGVKRVFPGK
jgi:outer membrane lipoprotein-sorting protein